MAKFKLLYYLLLLSLRLIQLTETASTYTITAASIDVNAVSFDIGNPYKCSCDLTQGSCDDHCCCDTDCYDSSKSEWRSAGQCLINIKSKSFCSLEDNIFQIVNVADRRNIHVTHVKNETGKGICVEVTPDPSEFKYSTLIDTFDTTKAQTLIEKSRLEENTTATTNPQAKATSYSFGYNILLIDGNSNLTLQTPDSFGNCDSTYRIRVGMNEEKRSCRITFTRATCTTDRRLSGLYVAEDASYFPDLSDRRTYYIVQNTSALLSTSLSGPTMESGVEQCVCKNVLTGLEYYININNTHVRAITIVPTVSDVAFPCAEKASVVQTSSALFISANSQISLAERTFGNPGYREKSPVRIGNATTVDGNDAISIASIPFEVLGISSTGNCLLQNSPGSVGGKTVLFGEDASYSCEYTVPDLSSFCATADETSADKWANLTLFNNFVLSRTYFGTFANANPNYIRDFTRLRGTTLTVGRPRISNGICTMNTKATLLIFYSTVGYYESYQNYIAEARMSFSGQKKLPSTQNNVKISFHLDVKFVNLDQLTTDVISDYRPSFIPQLPSDILYPLFFPTEESAFCLKNSHWLYVAILLITGLII